MTVWLTMLGFAAFVFSAVFVRFDARWAAAFVLTCVLVGRQLWLWRGRRIMSAEEPLVEPRSELLHLAMLAAFVLRVMAVMYFKAVPAGDAAVFWREIGQWADFSPVLTKSYAMALLYGGICSVFGTSLLLIGFVNCALGVAQVGLAYRLAHEAFRSTRAGVVAAFLTALNPISVCSAPLVMSETLFATLMLLFFFAVQRMLKDWIARRGGMSKTWPTVLAATGLAAFYCRGNGAFLLMALAFVLIVMWMREEDKRMFARKIVVPIALTALAVAAPVVAANRIAYGHLVVGSSDDSVWPLLAGTDTRTGGRWSPENYQRYRKLFTELTGRTDFSLYRDTHVVAPHIRAEIFRRWKVDPAAQLKLCWHKYRTLWSSGGEWAYGNRNPTKSFAEERKVWLDAFMCTGMKRVKEVLCALAILGLLGLFVADGAGRRTMWTMLLFLALNVLNHLLCEEKPRYCYLLWVMLPVWVSGVAALWSVRKGVNCE